MAELVNEHIGNQLQVSSALPGNEGTPLLPGRDPLCLGIGPAAIPGSIFASGDVLIGSPLSYPLPATPEAALMVARPNVATNPLAAKVPSIFKVTTKANLPPTPLDVMLGDLGIGMVGITVSSLMIDIINATWIHIISPKTTLIGNKFQVGMNHKIGTEIRTGVCNETGFKVRSGFSVDHGPRKISSVNSVPLTKGKIFTGRALKNKPFDISHPKEKGKRIRHICAEGPEAGIYIRGRLKDNNVIELPEYWDGLVDYDSITVQLQPIGDRHFHLNVMEIDKEKIVVKEADDKSIDCFYHVWVARWIDADNHDEKLHVVYEGESPDDYPGDNSHYTMGVH
tara:strand:- start:323 stop:1339 length:1017 start_codon:yes stop_codon:yes gene_type:complete